MNGPQDETARFWDSHYGEREQVWSGRPNTVLIDEVADLPPGKALDVGCGEGADAIWLALRGWQVTAVDVSRIALERGAAAAKDSGVDALIGWQLHDLAQTFPTGVYNLVSVQYLHAPIELPRDEILRRAASVVGPGGTLLVVGHASAPSWAQHVHGHQAFPLPEEVFGALGLADSEWVLETCEVRERELVGPRGEPGTVSDTVVGAHRRAN